MELKILDFKNQTFIANGVTYFIESEISIQRSAHLEMIRIELETGHQMGKWTEEWTKAYELCNQQKLADVAVICYNNKRSFKEFFEKNLPILRLCACFINTKDEDRRTITEDMIDKKINDWAEEGYSMSGFFALALISVNAEAAGFKNTTQIISDIIKEYNTKMSAQTMDTSISN